jgi:hypothetical protein
LKMSLAHRVKYIMPAATLACCPQGVPGDGNPPAFHLLSKPSGAICNLDCGYCFFPAKEMLYPGSRFRMADEMLKNYIRQLIESHRTPEVTIAWQGGEPTLMGLEFFLSVLVQPLQQGMHTAGGESDARIRRAVIQRDSMTHALIAVRHAVNAVRGITSIGIEVTKYNAALLHRCSCHNGRIQD